MTDAVGTAPGQATLSGVGETAVPNPSGKSVQESLEHQSNLENTLKAGLDVIDQDAVVVFEKYIKLVLPFDGWVFWVKANMLSPSAITNAAAINAWPINEAQRILALAETLTAPGSLHVATENQQNPDESFSVNHVIFTSKVPVQDLNEIAPGVIYIARISDYRFAFSKRESFYRQADLYHYRGDALYPIMEAMVIDSPADLDTSNIIVSNSLPIWLSLNRFMPMFPSFLIPDNIRPPYAAVDIPEEATTALQAAPYLDQTGTHWQLVRDRVKITIYGLRNFNALSFQDYIWQESLGGAFGIIGENPVIRDAKRGQVELSIIAMKKTITFEISYFQVTVRDVARQLIREALVTDVFAN